MFYYKRGNVICRTPWNKPSTKVFHKWWEEFRKLPGLNNYDVYLTGGFCQIYFFNKNIETWDIDIFLTSDPKININYPVLKNILEEAMRIGFKNNLLIDIYLIKTKNVFDKDTWYNQKIKTFKEIINKRNDEFWKRDLVGVISDTEIIPGLYLLEIDPTIGYNKFTYKMQNSNYELICKKLDISKNVLL